MDISMDIHIHGKPGHGAMSPFEPNLILWWQLFLTNS